MPPAAHLHGYLGLEGAAPAVLQARGREEVTSYGGAVTAGRVEPWGMSDVSPTMLVGSPNETILDLPKTLQAMQLDE